VHEAEDELVAGADVEPPPVVHEVVVLAVEQGLEQTQQIGQR
jgi:hypothetical protein